MSFWKTLTKIGNAVIEEGMKQQSKQMRNGSRKCGYRENGSPNY